MLIEFTVGNFRSFKDPVTLSMVATDLVAKDKRLDEENVIEVDDDLRLLKSAAIYGANASGKSNLVRAVDFMRDFVLNSSRATQLEDRIPVESFRLSTATEKKASFFQMVFLLDGKQYRYGFEVTTRKVVAEWLFFVPGPKEARLFERELDNIKVSDKWFKEGKGLEERTRSNALFLSVAAQFNGDISGRIIAWFAQLGINLGVDDNSDLRLAIRLFHKEDNREAILRLVKDLDLGISDIRPDQEAKTWSGGSENLEELQLVYEILERLAGGQLPAKMPSITTVHGKYDSKGNIVGTEAFKLDTEESAGTRRLFSLALPILNALEIGYVLFIDEIDARLHPLITCTIIDLFNSIKSNPKNAQLIFTTHNTSLLTNKRFRRDQIWFVEKDKFGATHVSSLAEFKVRNDATFEQDYIRGRYGAIPFIPSDITWVLGGRNGEE